MRFLPHLRLFLQATVLLLSLCAGPLGQAWAQEAKPIGPGTTDTSPYLIQDSVLIRTAGGHTLSAVVVRRREAAGPQPTALLFFLYSNLARSVSEARAAADRGYVGVVADVRGKRLSPEAVAPYEHEAEDVYEVIDWISRQPWSDGRVGMYGGSYSGFAQWAALKHRVHPALKTIVPYVAGIPGMGLPMENNVFLNANYEWAFLVTNNKYLDDAAGNDRARWRALARRWYESGRPYRSIDSLDGTPNPWLQRWLRHPSYDAYWQRMVPYRREFAKIDLPILAIDGYYNDGQAAGLHYLREHARYRPGPNDYLLIGPYDHFGAQRGGQPVLRGYAVDSVALVSTRDITFQWFDYVLKGGPKPALLRDHVNYEVMGANTWRHAPSLDQMHNQELTLYLTTAKAGSYYRLAPTKTGPPAFLTQEIDLADRSDDSDHNFNFPDPIIQDELSLSHGLAFVSEPVPGPVAVSGAFAGELQARINKRDLDYSVTLYEVLPDGRYFELSYFLGRASYARDPSRRHLLRPGRLTRIPFSNTKVVCRQLSPGSRLLVIVNANKNRFCQVNYGTGKDVSDESVQAGDARVPLRVEWSTDSYLKIPLWR